MASICAAALHFGTTASIATTQEIADPTVMEVRPLSVEHALSMVDFPYLVPIQLSPDGRLVAYTLVDPRRRDNAQEGFTLKTATGVPVPVVGSDVWVADTRTGEAHNISKGQGSSWGGVWSPDGRALAFLSDRSGSVRVYLWDRIDTSIRQVSDEILFPRFTFETVQWTPDGAGLLVKLLPEGMTLDEQLRRGARYGTWGDESTELQATVNVFRPAPSHGDEASLPGACMSERAEGNLRQSQGDLAILDVRDGSARRLVRRVPTSSYWLSPTGDKVAFMRRRPLESCYSAQLLFDLFVTSLANAHTRLLAERVPQSFGLSVSWSPDGSRLAYTTSAHHTATSGPIPTGDVLVVAATGGSPRNLTAGKHTPLGNQYSAPVWDGRGEFIYLIAVDTLWRVAAARGGATPVAAIPDRALLSIVGRAGSGTFWSPDGPQSMYLRTLDRETGRTGFARADLGSGGIELLFEEERSQRNVPFSLDAVGSRAVYILEGAGEPPDIWKAGAAFQGRRRLTHANPALDRYTFGDSRLVNWRSMDGAPLNGVLYLPAGYREGNRYPLLVDVYGGRLVQSARLFTFGAFGVMRDNYHLFTTRGYAVFIPDMPMGIGSPMLDVAKTALPGVDRVVEMGIADPDRIGVMGGSGGGYSTLALLVQSSRFRAAVATAGPANLISHYGRLTADGIPGQAYLLEQGWGRMGGTPWDYRSRYIENSPIFYLDRVDTPLLLIYGTADFTVPASEGDAVYVGMLRLDKEVEYARYNGEGHGWWGIANEQDYLLRVIDWLDRRLKGSHSPREWASR